MAPPPSTLQISCPAAVTATAVDISIPVVYGDPTVTGGKTPYFTKCTPISGSQFLVGDTTVSCQTTDSTPTTKSCSFNVHVAAPPRISVTSFDAYGDSITLGQDGVNAPCPTGTTATSLFAARCVVSQPYPKLLASMLQTRYTAQATLIAVHNDGVAGDFPDDTTSGRGLSRFNATVPGHVPPYQVLLLMFGANDLGDEDCCSGAITAMQTMIQNAQSAGIRVMLATLPPEDPHIIASDGSQRGNSDLLVVEFNAQLATLASQTHATLVDLHSAFPATSLYLSDGLHPTQLGYTAIANTFYTAIKSTLEVGATPTAADLRAGWISPRLHSLGRSDSSLASPLIPTR